MLLPVGHLAGHDLLLQLPVDRLVDEDQAAGSGARRKGMRVDQLGADQRCGSLQGTAAMRNKWTKVAPADGFRCQTPLLVRTSAWGATGSTGWCSPQTEQSQTEWTGSGGTARAAAAGAPLSPGGWWRGRGRGRQHSEGCTRHQLQWPSAAAASTTAEACCWQHPLALLQHNSPRHSLLLPAWGSRCLAGA